MTVTVERYYDPKKAQEDIQYYHPDISTDLMRQAGLFAFYSAQLVRAESQYDRISNAIDLMHARLDSVIRADATKSATKLTESQIKSKITEHPKMVTLVEGLRSAKEEVGFLKGTCEALRQRKDTLIQIAINSREELKGSPSIRR